MARLEYQGKSYSNQEEIAAVLADHGVPYERWGLRASAGQPDDQVLSVYDAEVQRLKKTRGYLTQDLIALTPATPNLEVICAKFDKEHHHTDDEVRFTVEGEGVFEIEGKEQGAFLKFTAEPGDLIVIPENRRHLFYLTDKKTIRCIRLFKDPAGWEAIYNRPS